MSVDRPKLGLQRIWAVWLRPPFQAARQTMLRPVQAHVQDEHERESALLRALEKQAHTLASLSVEHGDLLSCNATERSEKADGAHCSQSASCYRVLRCFVFCALLAGSAVASKNDPWPGEMTRSAYRCTVRRAHRAYRQPSGRWTRRDGGCNCMTLPLIGLQVHS